jgi:hypothetical protein
MFGSQRRRQESDLLAEQKQAAAEYRKETEDGIRNALDGQNPDRAFAAGWAKQRETNQRILDANVHDLEPRKRRR